MDFGIGETIAGVAAADATATAAAATAATGITAMQVAAAAALAGAATSGYSAIAAGQSAKKQAGYNATVQANAAQTAEQNGAIAAADQQGKTRRLIASQQVAGAANGIVSDSGSMDQISTQSAGLGELDSLRIQNNAMRQAQGMQSQATIDDFQGQQAANAGGINAMSSILGGASNAYFNLNTTHNRNGMG